MKIIALSLLSLIAALPAFAGEAELKQQLDQQAKQLQKLQEQTDSLERQQSKSASDTTLGGYGEISYNHYNKDSSRSLMDLKRLVLFVGHRFNDQLSLHSEIEWEHAVTSKDDQGESEIEQAYLNYQFTNHLNLRAGLFLMPFGFLNESHEPPVFYGVERNEVETRIIPSTWREGGASLLGSTDFGINWNVGLVTGFDLAKFSEPNAPLHGIHQELQLAKAHDLAYYGALNYQIPGYTFGGALYRGNSMQGNADYNLDPTQPNYAGIDGNITLGEVHTRWQKSGWDIEALYAKGKIGSADTIDRTIQVYNTTATTSKTFVPPGMFYGWLLQAAYQIPLYREATFEPFISYEGFNTQAKVPLSYVKSRANADHIVTTGFSFKPIQQVVVKADYQNYKDNPHSNRISLGLGYMF